MNAYANTDNITAGRKLYASDVKVPIDALDTALASLVAGTTPLSNITVQTAVRVGTPAALTVIGGQISPGQFFNTITTSGSALDDLATITLPPSPTLILLRLADASKQVRVRHGVGNIKLSTDQDFTMDSISAMLLLISDTTYWYGVGYDNDHVHTASQISDIQTYVDARVNALVSGSATFVYAEDLTVTAGESLSQRDYVYLYNDAGTLKAYKVDTDTTSASPVNVAIGKLRGFVTTAGPSSTGSSVVVRMSGDVGGFPGLTAGSPVYASTTTGGITQTRPNPTLNGTQIAIVDVGFAKNATTITVQKRPVIYARRSSMSKDEQLLVKHHADPAPYKRSIRASVKVALVEYLAQYSVGHANTTLVHKAGTGVSGSTISTYTGATFTPLGIGNPAGTVTPSRGQVFQVVTAGKLSQVDVDLDVSTGTPVGMMSLKITTVSAQAATGLPTTTALWQSQSFTPTASAVNSILIGDGPVLTAGYYAVTLSADLQQESGNAWNWKATSTSTYASGQAATYTTVWTAAATNDFKCALTLASVPNRNSIAQSFVADDSGTVQSIRLRLTKKGTLPTSTMTVKLMPDNAGAPGGTPISGGTSMALTLPTGYATIPDMSNGIVSTSDWIPFYFATPPSLTAGTTYWIQIDSTLTSSTTNYVAVMCDKVNPEAAGVMVYSDSGWQSEAGDLLYQVVTTSSTVEQPAAVGAWVTDTLTTPDVSARYDDGQSNNPTTTTAFRLNLEGDYEVVASVEVE